MRRVFETLAIVSTLALMVAAVPGAAQNDIETQPLDPLIGLDAPQQGDAFDGILAPDGIPPQTGAGAEIAYAEAPRALLRGLDTLSNGVYDFAIGVGETVAFERLIITLEACRYPEGDLAEDAYAFLRIRDERDAEPRFSGWMIASSPALSALDHPRYDVWVLSCSTD